MRITFHVVLTQSGHAPTVFQHRKTKAIEPIKPDESKDWKAIDNPDLTYHAVLWPQTDGVTGQIEIDSKQPIDLKSSVTIDL